MARRFGQLTDFGQLNDYRTLGDLETFYFFEQLEDQGNLQTLGD